MSDEHASHQQWLINQIKEIRTYSGVNKPITLDSALILDLHIDSLEMLELVTAIEEYTSQPLSDKVWLKWHYLQDVADYLAVTMGGVINTIGLYSSYFKLQCFSLR